MDTKTDLKDWIPVISKLVYPLIAAIFLLIYRSEISSFFESKIMQSEAEEVNIEALGFAFAIKQKAKQTTVTELGYSNLGLQTTAISDYHPNSTEEANMLVKKSTDDQLKKLILQNKDKSAFETLVLESGRNFSTSLLKTYVNQLGIKTIVFVDNGRFEGLIDSKLLTSQLIQDDGIYSYDTLKGFVVGINKSWLKENNTVLEVLHVMNAKNLSELAIVSSNREISYIVQRESLIAKLVASIITETSKNGLLDTKKKQLVSSDLP